MEQLGRLGDVLQLRDGGEIPKLCDMQAARPLSEPIFQTAIWRFGCSHNFPQADMYMLHNQSPGAAGKFWDDFHHYSPAYSQKQ